MPRSARVIVCTYEQLPHLRRALRGYLRQTSSDFALTVADDGSKDDTRAWLDTFGTLAESAGIPFRHVWVPDEGRRKTVIANEAVRRSEGEDLLIFTDGDCVPPAHFVERHLAARVPRSFQVGGAYRLTEEVTDRLTEADVDAGRHEALATEEQRRDLRRRRRKSIWGTRLGRRRRPKILGLNFAVDRALFQAVNGFDERFVGWGFEDSDLRDRLMRLRPRPQVKVLYGENDVYHLWHPPARAGEQEIRKYYALKRPVRCEQGFHRETAS